MGIYIGRSASHRFGSDKTVYPKGQPNPDQFDILECYPEPTNRFSRVEGTYALKVKYPNATNFEGNKILVLEQVSPATLFFLKTLDPHFSETGLAPIARFAPTLKGWRLAQDLVDRLTATDD